MLADIVFGLWVLMAGILGWQRRFKVELPSLVLLVISLFLARFLAPFVGGPVASITGLGPIDAQLVMSLLLWLGLYLPMWRMWLKWKSRPGAAGIRIEVDELGNPIVRGSALQAPLGALIGLLRGSLLYMGFVSCLVALVPSRFYKDGRGMSVIHPDSKSMALMRQWDPELKKIDWTARGLRTVEELKRSSATLRKAMKDPVLKAAWRSPQFVALRKNKLLLNRANRHKQGRKDATLLLWIPSFQKAIADSATREKLRLFAKKHPAAFDRKDTQRKSPKPKKKKRRKKSRR